MLNEGIPTILPTEAMSVYFLPVVLKAFNYKFCKDKVVLEQLFSYKFSCEDTKYKHDQLKRRALYEHYFCQASWRYRHHVQQLFGSLTSYAAEEGSTAQEDRV